MNLSHRWIIWAGRVITLASVLLALPSLAIWLGLPPEGDAVDYRVPIIRWMVRHGSYPNWPWTYVEDFPMLGELLMLPLYVIHPNLMRLAPITAYLGLGLVAGRLANQIYPQPDTTRQHSLFWFACASIMTLRPLAIQSNLLMTDNLASLFALLSLSMILELRSLQAGIWVGLAMATRYFIWGSSVALFSALLWLTKSSGRTVKHLSLLVAGGMIAPLPFIIRNALNNGDPIYPLLASKLSGIHLATFENTAYGRGGGIVSLLLLPYDMLYTNSFARGIFDYTLGKLFYVQLGMLLPILLTRHGRSVAKAALTRFHNAKVQSVLIFLAIHLLAWFGGSQQMRFFVPGLVIINLGILFFLFRFYAPIASVLLLCVSIFSVISIQKDSILMALGKKEGIFEQNKNALQQCLDRIGNPGLVTHLSRDGALGFFDHDFTFTHQHVYSVPSAKDYVAEFVYNFTPNAPPADHYIPWPEANPCAWRKSN